MKRIHAISVAALLAAILPASLGAQVKYEYEFTTVKENPVTSIKNQYRSGTCWCFSALSFLESEIIRDKKIKDEAQYPDLSEMFVVRNAYHDRAAKYVRLDGTLGFSAGSDFGDVMEVIRDYGILPQSAYSGMNYGTELPVQGELDAVLKGYVEAVVKNPNRNLSTAWMRGFDGILDAYLGELPADDPKACRDQLGINTDDYVGLTSLTHHPFYTDFAIEVQDNWRWTRSWNVPLDEFQAIVDNAIDKGYTVLWGGDVSEPGFTRTGLAILLDNTKKPTSGSDQERWVGKSEDKTDAAKEEAPQEAEVTQESRQTGFDIKQTTDDHGMHLFGIAKDQNGTKYYLIKNSWGETGKYKGVWYMSENFFKAKTLNIVVNKNAIPKDIQKKLGIK